VNAVTAHDVQWTGPTALFAPAPDPGPQDQRRAFRRPALLRFANDDFMEELAALLDAEPSRLDEYRARPETWRAALPAPAPPRPRLPLPAFLARRGARPLLGPATASGATRKTLPPESPLKLYQPGHQRHYLVSASLVCRLPGLPDRAVDTGRGETATFVVRRLLPPDPASKAGRPDATWREYAWVAEGRTHAWQAVLADGRTRADVPVPLEERLPLFDMTFVEGDRRRRMFAGVVPVGRREEYVAGRPAGPSVPPAPGAPSRLDDPRTVLFKTQVSEPWRNLIRRAAQAAKTRDTVDHPNFGDPLTGAAANQARAGLLQIARQDVQIGSWYVLLELADWLAAHLPVVWKAIGGQTPERAPTTAESAVIGALQSYTLAAGLPSALLSGVPGPPVVPADLAAALAAVTATGVREKLEKVTVPYDRTAAASDWPGFLFPLADPTAFATPPFPPAPNAYDSAAMEAAVTGLVRTVDAALPEEPASPMPEPRLALQPVFSSRHAWFLVRCFYERPACGPSEPTIASDPTEPFQMAAFFDPDAPARPVRIALPIDTTPAGLRKFDKNTAFMVSDVLCGQIKKAQGMTLGDLVLSVLPWPFHKDLGAGGDEPCVDGGALGMICSFSIPIITICALIMLMIIVSLFDFIFRWMPFFFLCFPFPKFSGKDE
jgi:hypothetical protein